MPDFQPIDERRCPRPFSGHFSDLRRNSYNWECATVDDNEKVCGQHHHYRLAIFILMSISPKVEFCGYR